MTKLISAVFEDRDKAEHAIDLLEGAGFHRSEISVLMTDVVAQSVSAGPASKLSEGAAIGATTGGALGAIVGSLVAVGSLVVPGLAFVAAGPLVAALAGAGAGGAAGTLIGGLVGAGIPEVEASSYGDRLKKGGVLVGVYADDERTELAKRMLGRAGGVGVNAA
jgi:hypothetical protein